MGPPSYMRSVIHRNVVMRHIPVLFHPFFTQLFDSYITKDMYFLKLIVSLSKTLLSFKIIFFWVFNPYPAKVENRAS
jgi:hypothetical protein